MSDLLFTLPESMAAAPQNPALNVTEDDNGVYVKGLTCHLAQTEEDALNLLFEVSIIVGWLVIENISTLIIRQI